MSQVFNLLRGGLQWRFLESRAKVQILGGGFGNGKTSGAIAKVIQIAHDYPGANILMARSTYPKLNDTLRKEFIKWMPKDEIKSFPMSVNANNTCTLKNGTMINFRYIQQQGKGDEQSTSNLLSATYDLVVVDQMEDPEISHKDFLDLLGRLRGSATYRGDDPSMPRTGPRWFIITLNPTRNWVYKKLVAPLHLYKRTGEVSDDLLCVRDTSTNLPKLKDGKPILMLELYEGATYENAHNLDADFIETLESAYQGQMKDRFLKGEWASYEGLIYPQYSELINSVSEGKIKAYLEYLKKEQYDVEWVESYDHGLIAPSCYLLSFVDPFGNIIVCDGFYKAEYNIHEQFNHIQRLRYEWGAPSNGHIYADPDIMRRKGAKGEKISDLFWSDGNLNITRGDNGIASGITKVGSYLNPRVHHRNPFTQDTPAPSFYHNTSLSFIPEEVSGYFWKRDNHGKREDTPQDSDDHAMDALKYLVTDRPNASELKPAAIKGIPPWMKWHEKDAEDGEYRHRA